MKNKAQVDHRVIRMVDEMLCYFYGLGSTDIKSCILIKEDATEMMFNVNILTANISDKELDRLTHHIKSPRLHELEEYYWGLSGNELANSNEMTLVGMMTDESEIEYDKETGDLYIKLIRKN